tara:strand:- start:442 stop:969 length:528 start_codon:yes stop_codon:yes gene_type:complete
MNEQTERFYNIFSWWLIVWYFLYINKVITANPFIAAAMSVMWDLFATYYITSDNTNNKSTSLNSQLVIYFRIFAIIMSHWVPLLTLPRFIDMQSILTLIALGIFYIGLLYLQGFSVYNVYGSELSNVKRINSLYHLFKLRYGSVPMGFIGFGFLFYTGYLLLKNPAKGSLLYKVF